MEILPNILVHLCMYEQTLSWIQICKKYYKEPPQMGVINSGHPVMGGSNGALGQWGYEFQTLSNRGGLLLLREMGTLFLAPFDNWRVIFVLPFDTG